MAMKENMSKCNNKIRMGSSISNTGNPNMMIEKKRKILNQMMTTIQKKMMRKVHDDIQYYIIRFKVNNLTKLFYN